jgi:hypothetical protein
MKLTFLQASVPLTKSYTKLPDGTIEKSSYPNVWEVSSIDEDITTLKEFEAAIVKHAATGHCLLKGNVMKPLVSESRKGSTDSNATTSWLCLDIDGINPTFTTTVSRPNPVTGQMEEVQSVINVTIDTLMESLGLKDVSYILQWSGSMGIGGNTLRCHIFIMLTKAISAPLIKQWLIQKNHEVAILREHQALTKTGSSLTWGLDITACQADKLIYIAPPTLKGIKNPLGRTPRISLVTKTQATYDLTGKINSTDQNRALTDARVLELRERDGLPKRKLVYKHVGGHEIMVKPGECIATETKVDRGFVYFNLNGGDSWAYFHPENNPDYIFNFKGEPVYLTKELLPSYWESLNQQAYREASNGLTYLAFLDRATSTYYRGTYDAANDLLDIYPAKNESMVRQFADANGLRLGPNIPEWDMEFNPLNGVRVDIPNRTINTFERTVYMKAPVKKVTKIPPMCNKIISHILSNDTGTKEHFMNWLACIAQNLDRTRTAWVFQGVPGTGKGLLFNKILQPLFGKDQAVIKRAGELTEKWTDFVQGKFIVFIDEIQTSALKDEAGVIANMKNLITEPTAMIRMMNRNSFAVPNYTNWIFASNKPDPVAVDKNDRRFNVAPYQGTEFPRPTDEEIDAIEGELQAFYHYLLNYNVDKLVASTPLQSDARNTLITLSQSTSESTADAVREGNMEFFLDQLPNTDAYKLDNKLLPIVESYRRALCDILCRAKPGVPCNVRRDELFAMFNFTVGGMSQSPATFTRFLGHRQLIIKPVAISGGKTERGLATVWENAASFQDILKTHFADMTKVKP